MKTIEQYQSEVAALLENISKVKAKATNENRNLNKEELAYIDECNCEIKDLKKMVGILQESENLSNDAEVPERSETSPMAQSRKLKIEVGDRKERFGSLSEQLIAVMTAARPGGHIDPRLYNAASGLSESVAADGGFLIQTDFSTRLAENLFNNSIIASRCQRIPISGGANSVVINGFDETSRATTRSGGVLAYWVDEAAEKTASKPAFRRVELQLKKLIGLCYLTDELMMDAAALEAAVTGAFQREFDFRIQDAIINGTGAGQPLGVLNSGCLVSVGAETGQAAATVVAENIVNMYARRFASQTGNYAWFYNQNVEPQLHTMTLTGGTASTPIYMPPGGLSDTPYARLMGLPAYAIEQAQTLGTQGDIMLCNFADGYLLAEKGGMQTDLSIHVRFIYDESVFRFVIRLDGQPWRASALTPYKGSSTQSHFIVLDTRS